MNPSFPARPTSKRTSVLVAEDHERTRTALGFLLKRHGYEVTEVNDGQAALDLLVAPDPPQIVLLDWEMPRLDGLHVCRAIRSLPKGYYGYTYIVMVTARDRTDDILEAFAAGVDDLLSKPVDIAQLLARLRCGERVTGLEESSHRRIAALEEALVEVRRLRRLLPVCGLCKKIRNDTDYLTEVDTYLREHRDADSPYGVCPDCKEHVTHRDPPEDLAIQAEKQNDPTVV